MNIKHKFINIILNLKLIYFVFLFLFSSCLGKPVAPTIGIDRNEISEPIVYVVRSDNENIKDIAQWYTGKSTNSSLLLNYNNLKVQNKLKKGDVILIPQKLLVTRKNYIKKIASKKSIDKKTDNKKIKTNVDVEKPQVKENPENLSKTDDSMPLKKPETLVVPVPTVSPEENVSDSESRRLELLKELMKK